METLNAEINVILSTDSIVDPLTGIGRYTLELAKGIQGNDKLRDVRYFHLGRWQDFSELSTAIGDGGLASAVPDKPSKSARLYSQLRTTLANSRLAVGAYRKLLPIIHEKKLQNFSNYIYHSPNFLLPRFNGPKIVTFHDLSILRMPECHPPVRLELMRPELNSTVTNADHFITDSRSIKQELIAEFGIREEKISAIPLAASTGYFPRSASAVGGFLEDLGLSFGQYILTVSTIEPRKNVHNLIEAYVQLPKLVKSHYPLVLVGGKGWNSEALHKRIRELTNRENIRYLGYVPEVHLPFLYAGARAFVFPSLYEGFGLPILEAQKSGTPVITSNRSSMPEVAGAGALYIDPRDPTALGSAIHRIVDDDELCQGLRAEGFSNASQYSWQRTVSETIDVYRAVARSRAF